MSVFLSLSFPRPERTSTVWIYFYILLVGRPFGLDISKRVLAKTRRRPTTTFCCSCIVSRFSLSFSRLEYIFTFEIYHHIYSWLVDPTGLSIKKGLCLFESLPFDGCFLTESNGLAELVCIISGTSSNLSLIYLKSPRTGSR